MNNDIIKAKLELADSILNLSKSNPNNSTLGAKVRLVTREYNSEKIRISEEMASKIIDDTKMKLEREMEEVNKSASELFDKIENKIDLAFKKKDHIFKKMDKILDIIKDKK